MIEVMRMRKEVRVVLHDENTGFRMTFEFLEIERGDHDRAVDCMPREEKGGRLEPKRKDKRGKIANTR
jgi:hypothetical protein